MSNENKPLEDKVAVVTGAGQGNGRAIALRLAADGAMVFGTDLRTGLLNELEDTGRESGLKPGYGRLRCLQSLKDADSLVARVVESYGKLDIMVNNAGAIWTTPFPDVTEDIWDRSYEPEPQGPVLPHAGRCEADDRSRVAAS